MAGNKNQGTAKKAKNDEFYTQYIDIESEMDAYVKYNPDVFRGKTILLPCDDPEWSNFTKYFVSNFARLRIKKLISTSYAGEIINREMNLFNGQFSCFDDEHSAQGKLYTLTHNPSGNNIQFSGYLKGNGDFRSDEIKKLRNEADIIITNPPISLFREFLKWILEADKKFAIIGSKNAITYKEVFPYLKDNKIWLGYRSLSQKMFFYVNDDYRKWILAHGKKGSAYKIINGEVMGMATDCWFTNIDHGKRHEWFKLDTMAYNLKFNKKLREKFEKEYGKIEYPHYDNYDAIEVPLTECIPSDYEGVMGVPVTFMDKYNPDQFEIIWQAAGSSYANAPEGIMRALHFDPTMKYGGGLGAGIVNGKPKYARILIKAKENKK